MYVLYYHYPTLTNNQPSSKTLILGVFDKEKDANSHYETVANVLDKLETIKQVENGKLVLEPIEKNKLHYSKLGDDAKHLIGPVLTQEQMDAILDNEDLTLITYDLDKESVDYLLSNGLQRGKEYLVNKLIETNDKHINYDWIINSNNIKLVKDKLINKTSDELLNIFFKAIKVNFDKDLLDLFLDKLKIDVNIGDFATELVNCMLFKELDILIEWNKTPINETFDYVYRMINKKRTPDNDLINYSIVCKVMAFNGFSHRQTLVQYKKINQEQNPTTWREIGNYAAAGGNLDILKKVNKMGDLSDKAIRHYLSHSSSINKECIDLLFNSETKMGDYLLNPNVNSETVQYLMDKGCELDNRKYLEYLVRKCNGREKEVLDVINMFLEEEIDMDKLAAWHNDCLFS